MKVSIQLDDSMGVDTWEGDLPTLPSIGNTMVLNSRQYTVIKVAWVLRDDNNPVTAVSIAATAR